MAIKGKSKSRARRAVTQGPRPAYVPVKRRLVARRGFQVTALAVVAAMAIGGIWFGLARERTNQRRQELERKLRTAVVQYQRQVEPALASVGQRLPPSGFSVLPALKADVDGLSKGKVTPKAASRHAATAAERAKTAAKAVSSIDVTGIVGDKGFDEAFALYMINSHSRMTEALELYQHAARLLGMAAQAAGDERAALLTQASGVLDAATNVFNDGYNDYVNAQQKANIFAPTPPVAPAGLGS